MTQGNGLLDRMERWLIRRRRLLVLLLIMSIVLLDIFFGIRIYEITGYKTANEVGFNIEFPQLFDNSNETVKFYYRLTVESDGPISANNKIIPKQLEFDWFAGMYKGSVNISDVELRFSFYNADTLTPYNKIQWDVVVEVNNAYRIDSNWWMNLSTQNSNGVFIGLNEGNVRIDSIAIATSNQTEYVGIITENLVFSNFPSRNSFYIESAQRYTEYRNNRLTIVSIVVAAISFSVPATAKVVRDLYWGKDA